MKKNYKIRLSELVDIIKESLEEYKMNEAIGNIKKGEFEKWCKRQGYKSVTCDCILDGMKSETTHVKRMANFAYNFGWKNHNKTCAKVEQYKKSKRK